MTDDATTRPEAETDGDERWPIGFILTIVMVALYVGYRLIQGVVLVIDWLF